MPDDICFTVSEITSAIQGVLEPQFRNVSIRGEVSNFKTQSSGHLYLTLKDTSAQISAAIFRSSAARLSRIPKEGDQVIARGEISVYAPRGSYQLIIRELQFLGVGELLIKLHELKMTLEKRGWFDPQRKKPLPKIPKKIGVITSPTGAVIQDILNVLTRRFSNCQVILNPVKVQGEGSAQEIAQAIIDMNRYQLADVLIVGRGGGSIEDLWAFNEEIVAKAIFESRIPIISAVGHETDFTIADWVADYRAPTPSAAAEIVIAEKSNLTKWLDKASEQSTHWIRENIDQKKSAVTSLLKHPTLSIAHTLFITPTIRLDDTRNYLNRSMQSMLSQLATRHQSQVKRLDHLRPTSQIPGLRRQIEHFSSRLNAAINTQIAIRKKTCHSLTLYSRLDTPLFTYFRSQSEVITRMREALDSIHPKKLLSQGYCLLFSEKGTSLILSVSELQPGQTFRAVLSDGTVEAKAQRVENGSFL